MTTRQQRLAAARQKARNNLLNQVDPGRTLPTREAEAAIDQVWKQRLAAAGQAGADTNRRNAAALRELRAHGEKILADLDLCRAIIDDGIAKLAAQVRQIGGHR